nr:MAG TPA: RimK-related lysine biosynthesis protein, Probable-dependent amine/thiol ligase family Amino-group [Bacteriophage sp.]
MTAEEAIEILHPDTTAQTLLRIEYYGGFKEAVDDACLVACEALKKQIPKKPRETRCALMCASCGHKITEKGCKKLHRNYCKKCGQRILWEDE